MEDYDLVTLDIAKVAKEKGFDWETHPAHLDLRPLEDEPDDEFTFYHYKQNHNEKQHRTSIPSVHLLQKWLREKNIFVEVTVDQTLHPKYAVEVYTNKMTGDEPWSTLFTGDSLYRDYNEALMVGLSMGLMYV